MIQELLTDMEIKVQNTRNMLYKTLWMMDEGQSVQLESAMLKRYGCSSCFEVADSALQIYAGLGYTTEVRVGRLWADMRGNMFGGGTHEIMAYIAGRQVAKKYRGVALRRFALPTFSKDAEERKEPMRIGRGLQGRSRLPGRAGRRPTARWTSRRRS